MKYTVFDIETLALPDDQLPPFDESTVAVGNLKDPAKIAAKIAADKAAWHDSLALSPLTGQVAMVGFKSPETKVLIVDYKLESDIVSHSLSFISDTIRLGEMVPGFNCFSFDLPFLIRRAWALKIQVPGGIRTRFRGRSYWNENLIDLRDEWLLGDRSPAKGTSSLDAAAKFLGLPPKLGTGADFATMAPDQRREYLTRDLEITAALYERIMIE